MTVPLSDARLTEIRERVPSPVCLAAHPGEVDKGHVWVTGSLSGSLRCSACHLSQRALDSDEAVLLREVDRLRAELSKYVSHEPTIAEEWAYLRSECQRVEADNEQLRAQVAEMRSWITDAAQICRDHDTSPVKRLDELTEMFNG